MSLEELFIRLGYKNEYLSKLINYYHMSNIGEEKLYENVCRNYMFLLSSGYNNADILMMTKKVPLIYCYTVDNMRKKQDDMIDLGYTREEVIAMTKRLPQIYGLSIENIRQKIDDMVSLGYKRSKVLKIAKDLPSIFGYSIDTIKQKIIDIMSLGYTKEEVINLTVLFPPIFSLQTESMKQKISDIMKLGYTKEDVIGMTTILPSIYGLSIENIREKINFYDSIGMHDLPLLNTKLLMQGSAVSYARYMFYREKNEKVTIDNYIKLFIGHKIFEKQYGITKNELLKKYNYEEYKEKKNGRII